MTELDERRKLAFSLPTQRCFLNRCDVRLVNSLFSAYAEVFPAEVPPPEGQITFLCLRRGVSDKGVASENVGDFSLPTQRCFRQRMPAILPPPLFSAYAEVFLSSARWTTPCLTFLCLRRGVSLIVLLHASAVIFSLPTQWCFHTSYSQPLHQFLFSAYAEVFPRHQAAFSPADPFLCLRRDVSIDTIRAERRLGFSLPTQRCFLKTDFR